ncbi:MAG: DinB family protein [Acidobacteria bacterium]|nr:DinB family protein [Acidobacteriota bacterium]
MTKKEILLEQFTTCYDENGWFVALDNALANLSAADAAWKTANLDNSIWEILAHLNYYNHAYLERFKGREFVHSIAANDETFAGAETVAEERWQAEIEKFRAIMNEWRELLENAPETKFDEPASPKNPDGWATVIALVNTHNAHHGGQIVVIRKLQGSWDASKGVS